MPSVPWMELTSMEVVLLSSLLTAVKVAALPVARKDTGLVIAVMLAREVEDARRVASFVVSWDILLVIAEVQEVEGEEADTATDTILTAEAVDAAALGLVLVLLAEGPADPGLALVPPEGGTADPGLDLRGGLAPGLDRKGSLDPDPDPDPGLLPKGILAAVLAA